MIVARSIACVASVVSVFLSQITSHRETELAFLLVAIALIAVGNPNGRASILFLVLSQVVRFTVGAYEAEIALLAVAFVLSMVAVFRT